MDIKDATKNLISIYEEIQKLKEHLKELEGKKKVIENIILKNIENDTDIETNNYKISCNEKKTYQTLSKDFLLKTIEKYLQSNQNIEPKEIINYLYQSREITKKNVLTIKYKK